MTSTLFLAYWIRPCGNHVFALLKLNYIKTRKTAWLRSHLIIMTSSDLTFYAVRSTYHNGLLYTYTTLENDNHVTQNRNHHSQGYPSKGRSHVSRLCGGPGTTTLISIPFRRSIMTLRRVAVPQASPKGYRQCTYFWPIV